MANPVPVTYSSPAPKVAGGRHSADLLIEYDIDAGNINSANRVIDGLRIVNGRVSCEVTRINFHWMFALHKAKGRRPTVNVAYTTRLRPSGWKPFYSADGWTWVQAETSVVLSSPNRVEFQFPHAFPADRVWIADKPVFTQWHFDQLAASLLADTSGRVSPSAAANSAGVILTTRAGTNPWGTQIGGNSIYGFVLEDSALTPSMGARKRNLVITCGVHAGEVEDGWVLRGILNFWLNGVGPAADQFRREWRVVTYFAVNPNGRRAGLSRGNTYNTSEDPNRDWHGAGMRTFDETAAVQDACALDVPYHDVHFDLHSREGAGAVGYYRRTEFPLISYQDFVLAFTADSGYSMTGGVSTAENTIGDWAVLGRGALWTITVEMGNAEGTPAETLESFGKSLAVALMANHTNGYLD